MRSMAGDGCGPSQGRNASARAVSQMMTRTSGCIGPTSIASPSRLLPFRPHAGPSPAPPSPMSRVLVVGWDGGTWSVAGPMAKAGRLPVLASLMDGGAQGVLESVPNMNSAPAWSTIATGLNPGRHGIFYFDQPVPHTFQRTVVNAGDRTGASLWRMVSEAGRPVVGVNGPISHSAGSGNAFLA